MNGPEFIRRARRYARRNRQDFSHETGRGKGSHSLIHIGRHRTIVPHGEIGTGLLISMLRDLNINRRDF